MKRDALSQYERMRDFDATSEPRGKTLASRKVAKRARHEPIFVVQRHDASHLHFDFRLELDGVLKSWAVPKGPSTVVGEKRLAVHVEDHPLAYATFEGTIPKGHYGAGSVTVWDHGTWTPETDPAKALKHGKLTFTLHGGKLNGTFTLVRMRPKDGAPARDAKQWLLLKDREESVAAKTARVPPPRAKALKAKRKPAPLPALSTIRPELATLSHDLPVGPAWLFEPKLDGYRILAWLNEGSVELLSRNGKDWTERFQAVADAVAKLRVSNAIVDGEVCALDERGLPSFQRLQNGGSVKGNEAYFIFDLLFLNGVDLRNRPLTERKMLLKELLKRVRAPLSYVSHSDGSDDASELLTSICKHGGEGVVAKRQESHYVGARTRDWLKIKCGGRQELIVAGYTAPNDGRPGFGALLLAVNRGARLEYAGKVGTGFSHRTLATLSKRMRAMPKGEPPEGAPRMKGATWIAPKLVAEIAFTEWTSAGRLRHPSFMGLREDKTAADVKREKAERAPAAAAHSPRAGSSETVLGVRITHPDRVIDEASQLTKIELARYHEATHVWSLPYLVHRPITLFRCPSEDRSQCFFQRHRVRGMPDAVHAESVGKDRVMTIEDAEGLLSLVQFGAVEIHSWGSRMDHATKPDHVVIDLDPDVALPFAKVVDGALAVREALKRMGLESFVKTTGGKGLHIVTPLEPRYEFDAVKEFALGLAEQLAAEDSSSFTTNMSKRARTGKIFIDYLRNGRGATSVAPYSPRARDDAPVSLPVAWRDIRHVDPKEFTVRTVPALLAKRRTDPWAEFLSTRQQTLKPRKAHKE